MYFALHKPKGVLTSAKDGSAKLNRCTVYDLVRGAGMPRVGCVGRLDYESSGLLLFTDNAALSIALTSKKYARDAGGAKRPVEKRYQLTLAAKVPYDRLVSLQEPLRMPGNVDIVTLPARLVAARCACTQTTGQRLDDAASSRGARSGGCSPEGIDSGSSGCGGGGSGSGSGSSGSGSGSGDSGSGSGDSGPASSRGAAGGCSGPASFDCDGTTGSASGGTTCVAGAMRTCADVVVGPPPQVPPSASPVAADASTGASVHVERAGACRSPACAVTIAAKEDTIRHIWRPRPASMHPAKYARHLHGGWTTVVDLVLVEGRNRQIRRLCQTHKLQLQHLHRVGFGPVRLGSLPAGEVRVLTHGEVVGLYEAAMPARTPPRPEQVVLPSEVSTWVPRSDAMEQGTGDPPCERTEAKRRRRAGRK